MRGSIRRLIAAVVLLALLVSGRAAADSRPERRDALVFLRVLAYDKQLGARTGDALIIAVVYPGDHSAAAAERDAWLSALAAVKTIKVAGRPVIAVPLRFEGAAAFDRRVAGLDPEAIIVCQGLGAAVGELRTVTRRRRVLSFSRSENDVRAGLAVAVVAGAARDEIVINLGAARAEGVKFDAGLLHLARLVEER